MRLVPISGLGDKAPACFLVETDHARLLLDFGEGPPLGRVPDTWRIGRVDAILLSHQHRDHLGALSLVGEIGNPEIWCTEIVSHALPAGLRWNELPLNGETLVRGIQVRTGRSGHAPGGVWIHLSLGDGLLYMGDNCGHSLIYAADPPPAAATVILDASYGDANRPIVPALVEYPLLADKGPLLLPCVPRGRGPEMALHLFRSGMVPALDDDTRATVADLAGRDAACLLPEIAEELARLAEQAQSIDIHDPKGVMIVAPAPADSGEAKRLTEAWHDRAEVQFVFSGYLQPGSRAEALVKSGRASLTRWPVHPGLAGNTAFLKQLGARTVLPAFSPPASAWQSAFAPARVVIEGPVDF